MTKGVEAVVFDIGNVLLRWDPDGWFGARIGAERTAAFFAETGILDANEAVDAGAPYPQTILGLIEQHPNWEAEIRLWVANWLSIASPEIPHSVALLGALRSAGVPVFALSNFGVETFEIARAAYPFLNSFDREYVSGHLRAIKPHARIYEILEEDCGIPPARLLFTDDRAENIAAAKARGWQVHLFDGPEGWANRLVAEGLLSQEQAAA